MTAMLWAWLAPAADFEQHQDRPLLISAAWLAVWPAPATTLCRLFVLDVAVDTNFAEVQVEGQVAISQAANA